MVTFDPGHGITEGEFLKHGACWDKVSIEH